MSAAKDFLNSVRTLEKRIETKIEQKQRLHELATKITPSYRDDGAQAGGYGDKVGNAATKIIDLEREIESDIAECVDRHKEAMNLLDRMKNPEHIEVLNLRWFHGLTFPEIAQRMGKSERWACNLHGYALQELDKLLKHEDATAYAPASVWRGTCV